MTYQQHSDRPYRPPFSLPDSPKKAIEEMISIVSDLQSIYKDETDALEKANIGGFLDLQEHKLRTAQRYETGVSQIIERSDEMKTVDITLTNKLKVMQQDFSKMAFKNKNALERMQRVTQRMGETIRSVAKNVIENRVATSYGSQGSLNKHKKGNMSVGISETA